MWVEGSNDGIRLRVRAAPGARRPGLGGLVESGSRLSVRVAARPIEGQANRAVEAMLAAALEVPKGRVRIVRGHRSRDKTVRIEGDPATLSEAASLLPEIG